MGNTWSEPVITRVRVTLRRPPATRRLRALGGDLRRRLLRRKATRTAPATTGPRPPTSQKGRAIYMVDINTGEVLAKKVFDNAAPR